MAESAVLVIRDEPDARAKTYIGAMLVGSREENDVETEEEEEEGYATHVLHTLKRAGLHTIEHGLSGHAPRPLSHALKVVEVLDGYRSGDSGGIRGSSATGTFAIRVESVAPRTLFSNGRIAVRFNNTTPKPVCVCSRRPPPPPPARPPPSCARAHAHVTRHQVRRLHAFELEANAAEARALAASQGRRLDESAVATESVCDSQCDSSWNFFYENCLAADKFVR